MYAEIMNCGSKSIAIRRQRDMSVQIAICDDAAEDIAQLSNALLAYDPLFEIISYPSGKALMD